MNPMKPNPVKGIPLKDIVHRCNVSALEAIYEAEAKEARDEWFRTRPETAHKRRRAARQKQQNSESP